MVYVYECPACGGTEERIRSISERNDQVSCMDCADTMKRIPSFNGGLKTEHPAWLDHHVAGSIQQPGEPPLTTRTEHDRYCREKGISQR